MLTETIENRYDELFEKYVPAMGKCETLAGEILRAVARIHHRYTNDGDIAWHGYGRETVNPAVRFLGYVCENESQLEYGYSETITEEFADIVDCLYDEHSEEEYEHLIDALARATIDMVENGKLGEMPNEYGDMLEYADPQEDVDRDEEDEFDYDEWERERFGYDEDEDDCDEE